MWNTGYIGDIRLLEAVQRRWTKHIEGFKNLSYRERLHKIELFSIKGRLLRADLILCWKIFHGLCAIEPRQIFTLPDHSGTRGHIYKISQPHVATDIRKRFYTVRVIPMWNSLPNMIVSNTDLQKFKSALEIYLGEELFMYYD